MMHRHSHRTFFSTCDANTVTLYVLLTSGHARDFDLVSVGMVMG